MSYDVTLRSVARLCDHTHFDIPARQIRARRGPYPYYGDLFERFEVDDYGIDAPNVIFISSCGRVLNEDGGFRARLEHGRCGSSAFAHILVPLEDENAEYILACLETLPNAIDYIGGPNQLQTLDELAVLRMALPWPQKQTRDAYVSALHKADETLQIAKQEYLCAKKNNQDLIEVVGRYDAALQNRAILIRDFMEFGVLGDHDCSPTEADLIKHPPHYSDARAERARTEIRTRREELAKALGGLAVHASQKQALGPLARIVTHSCSELSAEDVAWELAPLTVIAKAADEMSWAAIVDAARGEAPRNAIVSLIDQAIERLSVQPCFSLLPNLSYTTSVLSDERLQEWIVLLDDIDGDQIDAAAVRTLFDLANPFQSALIPQSVFDIVNSLAQTLVGHTSGAGIYYPYAQSDSLVDIAALSFPTLSCSAQFASNAALIQAACIRGVCCPELVNQHKFCAAAPQESALIADYFGSLRASLAILQIADGQNTWCLEPPQRTDPRWILGTPTRMRSTYAWIQQALSHLEEGGYALILLPTHELQTIKMPDKDLRRALIEEGYVRAVVNLPARIWGDERVPSSLLILCRKKSTQDCLMIDISRFDISPDRATLRTIPQRSISQEGVETVCPILTSWFSEDQQRTSEDVVLPGICTPQSIDALRSHEYSLVPCLYL